MMGVLFIPLQSEEKHRVGNTFENIPVVVLTTSGAEKDILRSYALHSNAYVTKPLDFDQFIMVVKSIANFWLEVVKLPAK